MKLTQKQKLACKQINEGKIIDIFTFIINIYPELFISVKKIYKDVNGIQSFKLVTNQIEIKDYHNIDLGRNESLFMYKDERQVKNALIEFLSLIKTLESEHLIIRIRKLGGLVHPNQWLIPYQNIKTDTDVYYQNNTIRCNQELMDDFFFHSDYHFHSLSELRIIPTLHLKDFVLSNYVTSSEKTNITTLAIGCIGIIIAIASSLYSINLSIKASKESTSNYMEMKSLIVQYIDKIDLKLTQSNNSIMSNNNNIENLNNSVKNLHEIVEYINKK